MAFSEFFSSVKQLLEPSDVEIRVDPVVWNESLISFEKLGSSTVFSLVMHLALYSSSNFWFSSESLCASHSKTCIFLLNLL